MIMMFIAVVLVIMFYTWALLSDESEVPGAGGDVYTTYTSGKSEEEE